MTEKATQSTAGNNILSQTEYDAVLSHMEVIAQASIQPNDYSLAYEEMKDLIAAGTPMRRDHIDGWLKRIRGLALASPQQNSIARVRQIEHAERAKRAIIYLLAQKRQ